MKITNHIGDHAVAEFTCGNTRTGEVTNRFDTASRITKCIDEAIARGQETGCVYAGGDRYEWEIDPPELATAIELTRDGVIVDTVHVSSSGWLAFRLIAARRGVDPRTWLATILGDGLSRDVSIREMLRWLFPSRHEVPEPSDEIQRFTQAQAEFHGEEVAAA